MQIPGVGCPIFTNPLAALNSSVSCLLIFYTPRHFNWISPLQKYCGRHLKFVYLPRVIFL